MTTFVIAQDGTRLMPTTDKKRVRKLLKNKRAIIVKQRPFTIQLQYESGKGIQPIEFKMDAGYQYSGISITTEKEELVSEEYQFLSDETEKHKDQQRYRRARRNRKRYRKARFHNRRSIKKKGWLAPSLKHKLDLHLQIVNKYMQVLPISSIIIETAQFDIQLVIALEKGLVHFSGKDYQHGEQYGYDNTREAVFYRDNHTCQVCGKGIKDGVILEMHHLGYWKGDRTNRMSNLLTVCTKCHTSKNHKENGVFYKLEPVLKNKKGMAFMNGVKYQILEELRKRYPKVSIKQTNGVLTKRKRNDLGLPKSHSNDAYCMGQFQPVKRCNTRYFEKRRRNNRVLSKFYDARYIDIRDGEIKDGKELSCNRTDRSVPRNNPLNERMFRGQKVRKGRYSIRKHRYPIRPHDTILYQNKKYQVKGVHNNGRRVMIYIDEKTTKSVNIKEVKVVKHSGGWIEVEKKKQ